MKFLVLSLFLVVGLGLSAQTSGKNNVDQDNDAIVSIYPNPASEFLNITVKNGLSKGTFKIFSALGTEIYADDVDTFKKIDLSDFKNNVYILNIYSDNALVQTYRFVVKH
jgi:hypothetical protein